MWDKDRVTSVGDGCYELRMERLSFVMLDVESSVVVRVARESDGVINLSSERFSVAAQSPAGTLSTDELGIVVRVAGQLQILEGGRAVGGQVGFETEGDLPGLMMLTPRPVVTAAAGGLNRAVMSLVVGEFERGFRDDFAAWRRQRDAPDTDGIDKPAPPPGSGSGTPAAPVGFDASGNDDSGDLGQGQGGWLL